MNHSGAFWKVRNAYVEEMRGLWAKNYTGDGFWSRGRTALSGQYEPVRSIEQVVMPEHLCGGTFRTRGKRKRKEEDGKGKPELSYAERQQRRIAKKFGKNGVALGDDEEVRGILEDGKRLVGKPRVAKSKRGRELRAAAALARFGQQIKDEEDAMKEEEVNKEESESESEGEYEEAEEMKGEEARDTNGQKILDGKGRGMFRVCEDENADDVHVKQEMQELQDLDDIPLTDANDSRLIKEEPFDNNAVPSRPLTSKSPQNTTPSKKRRATAYPELSAQDPNPPAKVKKSAQRLETPSQLPSRTFNDGLEPESRTCPICSLANATSSHLCAACSHVLDPHLDRRAWKCLDSACADSQYLNAGDCGVCGVCGGRRSVAQE